LLLLQRGADPNVKDNCGLTPLDRAAAGGHEGVVRMLLEAGASPRRQGQAGLEPAARGRG
jgi:Ankyrin repeat.